MNRWKCPTCETELSCQEAVDGWCETCGKRLPTGISRAAAASVASCEIPNEGRRGASREATKDLTGAFLKRVNRISLVALVLTVASLIALPFIWPLLVSHLPDERNDYLCGEIAAGLMFLAVGFGLFERN